MLGKLRWRGKIGAGCEGRTVTLEGEDSEGRGRVREAGESKARLSWQGRVKIGRRGMKKDREGRV